MPSSILPSHVSRTRRSAGASTSHSVTAAKLNGREPLPTHDPALPAAIGSVSSISIAPPAIGIALSAALITVRHQDPMVFVVEAASPHGEAMLPAGPLLPRQHRGLEQGVRELVSEQAGIDLGYTEQLYSFSEQGRVVGSEQGGPDHGAGKDQPHLVSIGYLALLRATHEAVTPTAKVGRWLSCYEVLPWEDWRAGRPTVLDAVIEPHLDAWANRPSQLLGGHEADMPLLCRRDRIDVAFGLNGAAWDEERALERHELLYQAGLLSEARRDAGVQERGSGDRAVVPLRNGAVGPSSNENLASNLDLNLGPNLGPNLGMPLAFDHRRMVAMALGRLRAKIKYRPIVFDLMDETFTLYELQCTVQAILGTPLHKQNFRRLVETTGLVEEVGDIRAKTGGRPAKLFRFRSHVVLERSAPGVRIKSMRG
jgi:hypothetical protein